MNQYIGPGLGFTGIVISGVGILWLNNKINTVESSINEKLKEHEIYLDGVPKLATCVKTNHAHIKFLNEKFLNLNKKIKNQNKTIDALQALSLYHQSMISVLHGVLTPLLEKSDEFDGKADLKKKLEKVKHFIVKNHKSRKRGSHKEVSHKTKKTYTEQFSSSNSESDLDSDSPDEYIDRRHKRGKKNKRSKKSHKSTHHRKKKQKKRRSVESPSHDFGRRSAGSIAHDFSRRSKNNLSSDSSDSSDSDSSGAIMKMVNGSRSKN